MNVNTPMETDDTAQAPETSDVEQSVTALAFQMGWTLGRIEGRLAQLVAQTDERLGRDKAEAAVCEATRSTDRNDAPSI